MLKKAVLMIGLALMSTSSFSEDISKDKLTTEGIFKEQDVRIDFPPIVDELVGKVGQKDELKVFVPKNSKLYAYYYLNANKEKFKLDKGDMTMTQVNGMSLTIFDIEEFPEPKYINKIDFYKNGLNLFIDVKNSPLKIIVVDDVNSYYSIRYTYGRGYVLKAQLLTKVKYKGEYDFENRDYIIDKYKESLAKKGYKSNSFFSFLTSNPDLEKDNSLIVIDPASPFYRESTININMNIYDKTIYDDYDNYLKKVRKIDLDNTYKELPRILK